MRRTMRRQLRPLWMLRPLVRLRVVEGRRRFRGTSALDEMEWRAYCQHDFRKVKRG